MRLNVEFRRLVIWSGILPAFKVAMDTKTKDPHDYLARTEDIDEEWRGRSMTEDRNYLIQLFLHTSTCSSI